MLLIIFLFILTIISIIIFKCNYNYWDTDILEAVGMVYGFFGGVGTIIAILLLIGSLCAAPANQASYETEYNKLIQKVEHIDSFNHEEVVQQVNEWNERYRKNTYARKSPWIGWYYTIDTSTTSLIELEDNNGN